MLIRTFLAVNLSVAVNRRIVEEVEKHKAGVGAGVRVAWVPAANLHLTLQFLGSIDEELIEGIAGRMKQRLVRHAPFELRARGLGVFPSHEKPRVLWVGADGGQPLLALQRDVESTLVELGLPKEERKFHPHLTVGRVKEADPLRPVTWSSDAELGMSQVHEMVVYESKTASQGSEYTARARVPLGK
jgi:2'-5' RNA ligase